ncbi:MAG: cell surface protein SprA [Gemmatimonadales bacterium]
MVLFAAAPMLAGAQTPADTSRAAPDSARPRPDSLRSAPDTGRITSIFGQKSDLGFQFDGRFESRLQKTANDRCNSSEFFSAGAQCHASFEPAFNMQFGVKTGGTFADRVHVSVDYNSTREFDASNNVSLYYEGKKGDWLQRLDVGNVSFDVPASRYITTGIPQGNYGLEALTQFGALNVRAIVAQQKGNVVSNKVFTVGGGAATQSQVARDIDDYQVEARRFFFVVDPRQLAGYPNLDILNAVQMRTLAASLPDSVRPAHVALYRLLIGGRPPNPNGPQFQLIGDPASQRGQVYEVLRENVDYVVDPSQLWIKLTQPLNPANERLVVAYTVRAGGIESTNANTGGTPDMTYVATRPQYANLLWDPQVKPGDPASFRELRNAYRIGGSDVQRGTVGITIGTGTTFDQQKPLAGGAPSFLQLFGIAQAGNPGAFDADNRIWPRPGDPGYTLAPSASVALPTSAATGTTDQFLIFPSLQPFARAGLAQPAGNPANDAIYTTPDAYLYSAQHPPPVFRIHLSYQSDGSGGTGITLGANQLRPLSERLTLDDGTVLKRDVDYTIDYDLGQVTFLHPETLFAQPRNVTVRYEENPLFVTAPTSIFGLSSTLPLRFGELNFVALGQSQTTTFTKPPLGYQAQSSLIAGINGNFAFNADGIARLVDRLPGATPNAPARVHLLAELATSRPNIGGASQAYLESFESDGGIVVPLTDPLWYLSSQPAVGSKVGALIGGSTSLDLTRAATFAWQSNGLSPAGKPVTFTIQQIDPLTDVVGAGLQQPEPVLWMTLYPLGIGGEYNDRAKRYEWLTPGGPAGRRWRSIRQVLSTSGTDLSHAQNIEMWALVDTSLARRQHNPVLVVDVGDVSENTVALGPTNLALTRGASGLDSTFSGRAVYGLDTLQSERDPFSRAFDQTKNDTGLPGDLISSLTFASPDSSGAIRNFRMCAQGNTQLHQIGDTRTNCTVGDGRLDEWDLDGDHALNFTSAQREQERLLRYAVDLGDARNYVRVGGCAASPTDSAGAAGVPKCWVLVRIPFGAPLDTIGGGPNVQRLQTVRLTMVSGAAAADDEFTQVPIARLRFTGATWLKRSPQALVGVAGERTSVGAVAAATIGTTDQDSTSGLVYQSPPGVVNQADQKLSGLEHQRIVINEQSMRLTATSLAKYERAEAYYRFPEGAKNFMQYGQLRAWARGRGNGWGQTGDLQFYVKMGTDDNNFYFYRSAVNSGPGQAAWLPEVIVDFGQLNALRLRLQNAYLQNSRDTLSCTGADSALIAQSVLPAGQISRRFAACANGYMVYTANPGVSAPNLRGVQELAVGIVRVDSAAVGATRIMPGDTLEVWVDDIRLANAVNTPGYAGQVGVDLESDLGSFHANLSHRDGNFRQLGEAASNVADDEVDLSTMVRLDRFFAPTLGYALPVTITHSTIVNTPQYLTGSDILATGIAGLRTPKSDATSVSLGVRRSTPLRDSWAAPIVNNLTLNGSMSTASSRDTYSAASHSLFTADLAYAIGGGPKTRPMPAWWSHALDGLPAWLSTSEFAQATEGVLLRTAPATFRFSTGYTRGDDRQSIFTLVAASSLDTAAIVSNLTDYWRNAASVDLQPFDALDARWQFTSLRDLRHYGDTSLAAIAATGERTTFLGVAGGLEREREINTSVNFLPRLNGWLRPRFDFSTGYAMLRDPSTTQLLHAGDSTAVLRLPERLNALQSLNTGAALDLARAARAWTADSALLRRLGSVLLPLDFSYSRALNSEFDGTPYTPALGYQLGLTGTTGFLVEHGLLASSAGSNAVVTLTEGFKFPFGMMLTARMQHLTTRNWLSGSDTSQTAIDGEQFTFPDLTLRATYHPRALQDYITSVTASARYVLANQRSSAPAVSTLLPADLRTSRVLSYPLGASIVWNDAGNLTTGFSIGPTFRVDSLPGSVTDSRAQDLSIDASRSFRLPAEWQARSALRMRLGFQQNTALSDVSSGLAAGLRSRIADNGRRAITLNADTDIAENLTFSLQSAQIVTFDNTLNRKLTQVVLSAVLQIKYFAGVMR